MSDYVDDDSDYLTTQPPEDPCVKGTVLLTDVAAGEDYDVPRVEELRSSCSKSFVNETITMYYCNSALSVIFFLLAFLFLVRKLKRAKVGSLMPFFVSIIASETLQVIVRHIYQKCALPIRGQKIVKSVVYYGFYTQYSKQTQGFLQEILWGTYFWEDVLLIVVHIVIILKFKKKGSFFVYPVGLAFFVLLQYGNSYLQSNDVPLNSFIPHICVIFSWLMCQLLENHVTNNIFLELTDSPWEAERNFRISRATTWLAFCNIMDVTPRGCAWFVLICTWRVVRNYVNFYTMYYEGYLIMFFIEFLKYIPGIKLFLLVHALRDA